MATVAATPSAVQVEIVDGIAVLTLDLPSSPVNVLGPAIRDELGAVVDRLVADPAVRAAILISGKPDSFIAGADIEQFLELKSAAEAEALSRSGHAMLDRLAGLRFPVVAAIHGACLGGGLETALACAYRICTDHPKTVLALPEVQLGLIPGAGGTQRLPRTVGIQQALTMILEGRNVRAKKALQTGLVDEMVHPAILRDVALQRARELADGRRTSARRARKSGAKELLLEDNALGRSVIFSQARKQVLAKTHGHYPAPLAAIDAVRAGYEQGREKGFEVEARLFGELTQTPVSKQLVFLFFATTALKKDMGVAPPVPAPHPVDKLGILGAGFMGAGIASVAVQQGTLVRLKDTDDARVGKGLAAVREVLDERRRKKQITGLQLDDMMAMTGGTTTYTGFGNVDLVIEAVFEDLALKHRVLRDVEPLLPRDAVYASNTSTIPIARIAEAATRPEQVLGMHFFSPVPKMPLLEVIVTPKTAKEATVTAVAYGRQLGKTVIIVNDGPGFYTTRVLAAYLNEAGQLLQEGAAVDALDRALVDFGFPVGPATLMDEVGLDVGGKVGQVLYEAFGERMIPSDAMRRLVESGRLGRKGKSGFYTYDEKGKKGPADPSVYAIMGVAERRTIDPMEIVERCVLAMVNEAARCLGEGILRSARDGDVGAVFGIGFPPFRGGPFRYVDSEGVQNVVARLEALDRRFAPRFTPAALLTEMARTSARFYPATGKPVD